jgi:branched-chain amino acid transport system ATP-binding protein
MDVVFDVADKITVLHFGEVLMDGDKESIKAAPAVQQAYFGTLWKS